MARSKAKTGLQGQRGFYQETLRLTAAERGVVPLQAGASLRIALVYPNAYDVGMASMGYQTVYRLLNAQPGVRCERFFLFPAPHDGEMRSLESFEKLSRFDVVAFSVSFELDIPNVILALMRGGVPPLAKDRGDHDPIVLLGGIIASLNPSPLLPFMDSLLAGEGEGHFAAMTQALGAIPQGRGRRQRAREALAALPGFYVPGLSTTVQSQIVNDLDNHPVYTPIVTPHSHFASLFVMEVGRGCKRGCFFCAAQKVYTPVRVRSLSTLLDTLDRFNPGADRVGLESAGISDYPDLVPLCQAVIDRGLGVSFSSVRADRVTPEMVDILVKSQTRSFTIAPEAGSEALRRRIGKGLTDAEILRAVDLLRDTNIDVLKLYYLIGLPGETEADIDAIIDLSQTLADRFRTPGRKRQIRISVNAFIPKPFTEFQWAPLAPSEWIDTQHRRLERELHRPPSVHVVKKSGRQELWQALLAQGDETLGLEIAQALSRGMPVTRLLSLIGQSERQALFSPKGWDAQLPWEFIQYPVDKALLWRRATHSS